MPAPDTILRGLTALANEWRSLAIAWHIALAALILLLLTRWRPPTRLLGRLIAAPLASVAVLAWLSGNPFNGITFVVLATVLIHATRFSKTAVRPESPAWVVGGAAFIVFGSTYPHFLHVESWTPYLYAAPFGILPCPTLSVAIGMTLAFQSLRSRAWSTAVAVAGVWYGTVGIFALGVVLDAVLVVASTMLAFVALREVGAWRSVHADHIERTRPLPGDDLIPAPMGSLTHAITIAGAPNTVWPWLVQMGAGTRAGWYSYDTLDNGRRLSATRVIPELQQIMVGSVFPALPGVTDGFTVLAFEPARFLILGWAGPDGKPLVTWSFFMEHRADNSSRLVVRARGGQGYRFHGLPPWLSAPVIRFVHFLMQRKQLMGIAQRVEGSDVTIPSPAQSVDARRRSA